jgi:hypothetical protein
MVIALPRRMILRRNRSSDCGRFLLLEQGRHHDI